MTKLAGDGIKIGLPPSRRPSAVDLPRKGGGEESTVAAG